MTNRFNEVSNWVASRIIATENLKARAKVLKKVILVAGIKMEYE